MKIFNWVQNKLISNKSHSIPANHHIQQQPWKEEFSDWPHGLLAIGTFGNKIKQEADHKAFNLGENFPSSSQDHLGKLQKEFNLIFHEHVGVTSPSLYTSGEAEERDCCASSESDDSNNKNDHLQCSTSTLVHSIGKDICLDNPKVGSAIGKKSLSFLLKKMFVCRSGFSLAPSLKDPILESRMEKMLRTILRKKIYPQISTPKLSTLKSLESSHIPKTVNGDEKAEKADVGSNWVKTDSEYIVLEI